MQEDMFRLAITYLKESARRGRRRLARGRAGDDERLDGVGGQRRLFVARQMDACADEPRKMSLASGHHRILVAARGALVIMVFGKVGMFALDHTPEAASKHRKGR